MGPGEWFALAAISFTVIGLLGRMVWLLATMKTKLDAIAVSESETHNLITLHAKECDEDRIQTGMTLETHGEKLKDHGKRIVRLESGP